MRSTPAEEIFHALDSFRIGLQEARLPWFCRSSGTGWRNINGVTVTCGRKCRRRARTGCTNYSLFMRDDGLLVSQLETDDFEHAVGETTKRKVNDLWQREMAGFFVAPYGAFPDRMMRPLEEVFHLT